VGFREGTLAQVATLLTAYQIMKAIVSGRPIEGIKTLDNIAERETPPTVKRFKPNTRITTAIPDA